ncbi:uncharacterized protein LOC122523322 [Polistes fuscatus]|uniref:uncharacterized protein LOC122523322 n=1 Tax=Polistes fuscatus TaxID=30207 RepID=UPI001CA90DB7|nr:uncharacterized protein LOC122523322 [Polistes fuscatus]
MSFDLTRSPPVTRAAGRNEDAANMAENTRRMPQEASTSQQATFGAETASNLTTTTTADLVNEVTVRLPTFLSSMPDIWFQQIEYIFKNRRITSDARKFELLFEALTPDVMDKTSDFLRKPPEGDKYNAVKRLILQRLTDSKQKQILRFLNELQLGDRQPSQFLREMRNLTGDLVHEEFLRTKFLQSMPTNIRTYLVGCTEVPLGKLADVADAMLESCAESGVMAVSHRNAAFGNQSVRDARMDILEEKLNSLILRFDSPSNELRLAQSNNNNYRRSRSRSVYQGQRSPSRSRSQEGICYYHRRFGINAQRCTLPCSFSQTKDKQGN